MGFPSSHPAANHAGLLSTTDDKAYHFWCAAEVYAGFIDKAIESIVRAVNVGGAWWEVEGTLVPLSRRMVNRAERCEFCGQHLVDDRRAG